eukprot:TRINITY_DN63314_c0_g1_i1.p1 TRINITY_DN63314_c0_g1~~TRINITY_DN63314_c0_g1_i1.p1  ORF type:complete len:960 (+),score=222.23 TRINITY_DN63314_c0_g1_i1:53-2932(+)
MMDLDRRLEACSSKLRSGHPKGDLPAAHTLRHPGTLGSTTATNADAVADVDIVGASSRLVTALVQSGGVQEDSRLARLEDRLDAVEDSARIDASRLQRQVAACEERLRACTLANPQSGGACGSRALPRESEHVCNNRTAALERLFEARGVELANLQRSLVSLSDDVLKAQGGADAAYAAASCAAATARDQLVESEARVAERCKTDVFKEVLTDLQSTMRVAREELRQDLQIAGQVALEKLREDSQRASDVVREELRKDLQTTNKVAWETLRKDFQSNKEFVREELRTDLESTNRLVWEELRKDFESTNEVMREELWRDLQSATKVAWQEYREEFHHTNGVVRDKLQKKSQLSEIDWEAIRHNVQSTNEGVREEFRKELQSINELVWEELRKGLQRNNEVVREEVRKVSQSNNEVVLEEVRKDLQRRNATNETVREEFRQDLQSTTKVVREELRKDLHRNNEVVREEVRKEFQSNNEVVWEELRKDLQSINEALREEIRQDLHSSTAVVREELRGELQSNSEVLRGELQKELQRTNEIVREALREELRNDTANLGEALHQKTQSLLEAVAEQLDTAAERLDAMDVRSEAGDFEKTRQLCHDMETRLEERSRAEISELREEFVRDTSSRTEEIRDALNRETSKRVEVETMLSDVSRRCEADREAQSTQLSDMSRRYEAQFAQLSSLPRRCEEVGVEVHCETLRFKKELRCELDDEIERLRKDLRGEVQCGGERVKKEIRGDLESEVESIRKAKQQSDDSLEIRVRDQCRTDMKEFRGEIRREASRLTEAVSAKLSVLTERCEAAALDTRRECRAWVDGALRKLEDLALKTRERLGALAAERRDAGKASDRPVRSVSSGRSSTAPCSGAATSRDAPASRPDSACSSTVRGRVDELAHGTGLLDEQLRRLASDLRVAGDDAEAWGETGALRSGLLRLSAAASEMLLALKAEDAREKQSARTRA